MGVGSNWQAEGRISVSSSCKRKRAGATEICSGERWRSGGEATGVGGDGIILSVNSVVVVLDQQVGVRWQ